MSELRQLIKRLQRAGETANEHRMKAVEASELCAQICSEIAEHPELLLMTETQQAALAQSWDLATRFNLQFGDTKGTRQ
jgi:hypothetical protein